MKGKSTIVFVNQSSGYLMIDIIAAFRDSYNHRVLISGTLVERNHKLDNDVKWENIIPYDRRSTVKRLYTWIIGFLRVLWLVKTRYREAHLFLVSNPPLTAFIPLLCKNSFDLLVYDVYPDALTEFGVFKQNSWIVKVWKKVNFKVYQKAEGVFTISKSMKERLLTYSGNKPVQVVPVWADGDFLKPLAKAENSFLHGQNIGDKFIVMYSGNLGRTHDAEILVELARRMQNYPKIFFLIIGGGDKEELIINRIKEYQLSNCRWLPWQPIEELPKTLSAADIGVVSLGKKASALSIPSKTFSLLAMAKPLLCIADPKSELAALVKKNDVGESFSLAQVNEMVHFILKLACNPDELERLSENALRTSHKFKPENAKMFVRGLSRKRSE